jgi:selenocysteine lyase/cysteine desulfurase
MQFPLDDVRSRFPALRRSPDLPAYLDNPAGTLVPQSVIDAVSDAM